MSTRLPHFFPFIQELKQQNTLLSQTKALLQEEVNSLQSKVEKLGELQADNAALSVQVESLEKENQEESVHMQELLQQNVHLELDRDNKYVVEVPRSCNNPTNGSNHMTLYNIIAYDVSFIEKFSSQSCCVLLHGR